MRGFRMSVPAVRRIVVGVDGSTESAAAFRWACREASLRGAEVHAVHVREAKCHSLASYAVPAAGGLDSSEDDGVDIAGLRRLALPGQLPGSGVEVRTEVVEGLAARVLLDRCAEADMLVLGTASDTHGVPRSAGPVIRACLRRAPCPVVVIGAAQDPISRRENAAYAAEMHVTAEKVPAVAGV
jgi:nucleotide-binding universal stress UspA family protein